VAFEIGKADVSQSPQQALARADHIQGLLTEIAEAKLWLHKYVARVYVAVWEHVEEPTDTAVIRYSLQVLWSQTRGLIGIDSDPSPPNHRMSGGNVYCPFRVRSPSADGSEYVHVDSPYVPAKKEANQLLKIR
jgi:hypothetical protein